MATTLLSVIFILSLLAHTSNGYTDPVFQKEIEYLQNFVTEDQIRVWWLTKRAEQLDHARTFPICYDTSLPLPGIVTSFKPAFESLKTITWYDPEKHTIGKQKSPDIFLTMELLRIGIGNVGKEVIPGAGEGKVPYNLTQWAHFTVKFARKVKGLYVQSVTGPLGIPSGEFRKDFRCNDGNQDVSDYYSKAMVEPCHFAPRADFTWPNVFVYKTDPTKDQTEMTFRYRWTESPCYETAFFQFILIATEDFVRFHPVLSPVYHYKELDSLSGVPANYHRHYKTVACGLPAAHPYNNHIVPLNSEIRILPNKPYDDCVLNGVGREKTGLLKDTCPPGYFVCGSGWKTEVEWRDLTTKWLKETVTDDPKDKCCELTFPLGKPDPITTPAPTTTPTTPAPTTPTPTTPAPTTPAPTTPAPTTAATTPNVTTPNYNGTTFETTTYREPTSEVPKRATEQEIEKTLHERIFNNRTKMYEKRIRITHGDYCILVWLIFTPIANIAARFFKDFAEITGVGLGFWFVIHGILHSVSVVLIWWSLGLVVGTGNDKLGNVGGFHLFFGLLVTLVQHGQFGTGLRRPENERTTFRMVLSHSVCGYGVYFIACLEVFISNAEVARKLLALGLCLMYIVTTVSLHFVERYQDQYLNVIPRRALFPILQRIVMIKGSPPMGQTKIIIFSVLCTGSLSAYAYVLVAYSAAKVASL